MGTDSLINLSNYMKENTEIEKDKSIEIFFESLEVEYETLKNDLRQELEKILKHLDNIEGSMERVVPARSIYLNLKEVNETFALLGGKED